MSFTKKTWTNRTSEYPTRRKLVATDIANVYDVERQEGTILTEGDAFSADNMNNLEGRIETAVTGVENDVARIKARTEITLLTTGWVTTDAPFTRKQTVSVPGITADDVVHLEYTYTSITTAAALEAYQEAYTCIQGGVVNTVADGLEIYITGDAPTTDFKVAVVGWSAGGTT